MPAGTSTAFPLMVSFGIALLRRHFTVFADARLHLGPEMADQPLDRPRGAFAAGRALATALVLVEFRQPRDRLDDVGALVHHDDRGGAQPRFDVAQRVEIHQHGVADRFRDHRHGGAAWDHAQKIVPAAAHAAGIFVDEFPERNAHRLFDVARLFHVARDAIDLCAFVLGPADAGEPGAAAAQDGRHHGDALDVVDRGRAAVKADAGGERRLQARLALLALERFQERGLLAADIGAGAAMEIDFEIEARAARVRADQLCVIGLVDCGLEIDGLVVELAADIDVTGMRTHRARGQERALDQLVRIEAEDVAILASAGLALVRVDHQIARPVAFLGHEGPFEAGGKTRPAAPAQARGLDLVHDPVTALADQLLGAVPIAALPGAGQAPIELAVEIGEDAVLVGEHYFLPPAKDSSLSVVAPPSGAEPWRFFTEPTGGALPDLSASISAAVELPSRSS